MIAKAGKQTIHRRRVHQKVHLTGCKYICPEKKSQFNTISLSAYTVAEHVSDMSSNSYEQLCEKAKCFGAYSSALDESTDITDTAQLAIHLRGIDGNFEVI